jgi:hypothetical protein
MDTSGFAQVGKFGTLSLLKNVSAKRLNLPAQGSGPTGSDVVVTSFGIDTEELTFGRDPSCSVRLYYPDVAVVHCKIMFEERKVGSQVSNCKRSLTSVFYLSVGLSRRYW